MQKVLEVLSKTKRDKVGEAWMDANELQKATGLEPADINDAVEILEGRGQVKTLKTLGTAPFKFRSVTITARGRLELE